MRQRELIIYTVQGKRDIYLFFGTQYRSDLLSSVQNDVGFGNEGTEGMQKCSRSVPSKPRNEFERNERALELVLRQRSREDAGGKK